MYNNIVPIDDKYKCVICDIEFKNSKQRTQHLKEIHGMTYEKYIISIYFNNEYPICKCGCGSKMKFIGTPFGIWFNDYTTNHFPHKKHTEETKQKIKENTQKSLTDKYGVDNIYKDENLKKQTVEKIKQTKLERYNDKNYNNIDKCQNTKLERYNDKNYNNIEQIKSTNNFRYDSDYYINSDIGKNNIKTIIEDKYGVSNIMKVDKFKQKLFSNKIAKYGYYTEFIDKEYRILYNGKTSKIEIDICDKIKGVKFYYKNKEYDIKLNNDIFEIEGDFYHPTIINNLTLIQLNSLLNDYVKMQNLKDTEYNLYKIHTSDIIKEEYINVEKLKQLSYIPNYSISYNQIIISKEYFKHYIDKYNKSKLEQYIKLLLKFIRTLTPNFPYSQLNENLNDIIYQIENYDLNKIYNNFIFNNNSSLIGVNYLKSSFKSYWSSSYKNQQSIIDAWYDDNIMYNIIKYRIGINNNNEIYDFSLRNLIKGLSANKYSISFFKPILAATIYDILLDNKQTPIVLDPCMGFGGRMLGFISKFQTGTYIGCEPNKQTFNELTILKNNLIQELNLNENQIQLYNCKFEDFKQYNLKYDILFTSIPYYDIENYNNEITYKDLNEWNEIFFKEFYKYNNVYININKKIFDLLELKDDIIYKIRNNTTHFDKNKNIKYEYIIKLSN